MAVEEVFVPPRRQVIDPKGKEKNQDDPEYWEKQKSAERAKREYLEEHKMIDNLNQPPAPAVEPPFTIKGSVNLGNIDVQEQQKLAREETERAQKDSEARIAALTEERNKAIEALHSAELAHVRVELGEKIEALSKAIAGGSRKSIVEELTEVEDLASKLGYAKPAGPTGVSDFSFQIELKKLEHVMKKDDREFQRMMKKDERDWQLELRKLDQQIKDSEAKLAVERDRWSMIAQAPERVGAVIVKGLMQNAAEAPSTVTKQGKAYHIECGEGEVGEVDCPQCKTPVGIGPTARTAVCAKCGSRFNIKRTPTPGKAAAPEKTETEVPAEEE